MGNGGFAIALLAGSGALALWLDMRLRSFAPATLKMIAFHGALALVAIQLIPGAAGSAAAILAIVFGIALPALVYLLLVTCWFIRHAQAAIGLGTR